MVITKIDFVKVIIGVAAVFLVGLSLGYLMDTSRTAYLGDELREANLETEAFLVSELYMDQMDRERYCEVAEDRIFDVAENTRQLGEDLTTYSGAGMFRESDYKHLQQRYFLYQIRFLTVLEEYKDRCDEELVTAMYFFGDNVDSDRQGAVLTQVRRAHQGNLFVFNFNTEAEKKPVVSMIMDEFNVTQTPTIVLDQEEVLRGYTPETQLTSRVEARLNGTTR